VNRRVAARSSEARRVLVSAVVAAAGVAILSRRRHALERRSRIRWSAPVASNVSHPLAARVIGHGPPIALLHGLGASGRYWGSAYDRLGVGHRLIVPDLLGFGASPRPDHGYGPDEHAKAIAACLDSAQVREPAVLAAHSAGVIVALRIAATRPELVRAVIAIGPPIYKNAQDARRHLAALGAMARLFANDGHLAELTCRWVCKHRDTAAKLAVLATPDLPAEIARDGVQHSWSSYSETLTGLLLTSSASDWLDDVEVPIVLIAGDRDAACDLGWLRTLSALHPNVSLEIWNGDHHLPLTDPGAVIQRILAT
jgi:pimeloyl-ACP methyl ester carboxylesterase